MSSKSRPSTAAQSKGLLKRRMPTKWKLSKANPPRTFHAFPNLPPELQNMIWRYSLPGPRVIRAAYVQRGDYAKTPFVFRDARPPTALHVCQHSREEALKFYKLLSESVSANDDFEYDSEFECDSADDLPECHPTDDNQSQDSGSRIPRSRSIYFDPALDTIYLMTPFCQKGPLYVDFAEGFPGINQIQSLAIDYYPGSHIIEELFHIIFCSEENLTEILLAVGPGAYSWEDRLDGRSIKFVEPKDDTISIPIRMYEPQLPRQKWKSIEADLREQFNEMFPSIPNFRVVEVEDN
ncbi:hypothetical protein ACHAP3_006155 [Botrytis cinerea]